MKQFRENTSLFIKKKIDTFFTPKYQRKILFSNIENELSSKKNILIPGAGTGEYIHDILDMDISHNICAVEKNILLFDNIKDISNIQAIHSDFLQISKPFNFIKYDIVISTPPSYYINKNNPIGKKFKHWFHNRTDICSIFIRRSIELTKNGGTLAFIVPEYILNHSDFQILRNTIDNFCTVIHIQKLSNLFMRTSFNSILFILKKNKFNSNFNCTVNKNIIYSLDLPLYKNIFDNVSYLSKLDAEIFVGHNYTNLERTKDNTCIPIIYNKNISISHSIELFDNNSKQYILPNKVSYNKLFNKPSLVFNRFYGDSNDEYVIHYALCTLPKYYCNSNTIVIQFPSLSNEESIINIHSIIQSFKNTKMKLWSREFLKFGQISPYQLLYYLPIYQ